MDEISWTPLDLPIYNTIRGSTQTFYLARESWPQWARDTTQMRRLWVYCPGTPSPSTATTAAVVGRILTERFDRKDHPSSYNYNYYLIAESTSGVAFQSGPLRTTDPPHHSTGPADSLDAYQAPPSN